VEGRWIISAMMELTNYNCVLSHIKRYRETSDIVLKIRTITLRRLLEFSKLDSFRQKFSKSVIELLKQRAMNDQVL
jgi:hypothetical protein